MQDASGLSRSDLVTPHGMAGLLAAMDRHRYAAAFRDSLPVAGVDGTLATRMEQPRASREGGGQDGYASATSTRSADT